MHYRNSTLCRMSNILSGVFWDSAKKLFAKCKIAFAKCSRHSVKNLCPIVHDGWDTSLKNNAKRCCQRWHTIYNNNAIPTLLNITLALTRQEPINKNIWIHYSIIWLLVSVNNMNQQYGWSSSIACTYYSHATLGWIDKTEPTHVWFSYLATR